MAVAARSLFAMVLKPMVVSILAPDGGGVVDEEVGVVEKVERVVDRVVVLVRPGAVCCAVMGVINRLLSMRKSTVRLFRLRA